MTMMKKLIILPFTLLLLMSCQPEKKKQAELPETFTLTKEALFEDRKSVV